MNAKLEQVESLSKKLRALVVAKERR